MDNSYFTEQYQKEVGDILTFDSILLRLVQRKPLTRWQRLKLKALRLADRIGDAWDVLLGRSEVGAE